MDIRKKQRAVVDALEDIKARDIVVFNTERLSPFFERVVIASGDSTRQVKALADNVEEKLRKLGARVHGVEGGATAEWVLVDLGDVVVHVMHPTTRLTYNLEELWGGKDVKMKREAEPTPRAAPKPKPKSKSKPLVKKKALAKPRKAASAKKKVARKRS
jgi:ribosome-associated protein